MMTQLVRKIQGILCLLGAVIVLTMGTMAEAAQQPIWLEINQAYLYQAGSSPITRVAVANPAIADVVVLDRTKLNIVGKALGSTSLTVWSANGMQQDFVVSVCNADTATAQYICQTMGLDGVQVSKVGDKLVLQGVVENQYEMNNALGIAQLYADKDNIVNLIQMKNPTMVNLSALVIDVSGQDKDDLGFKYGVLKDYTAGTNGFKDISFGTVGEFYGGMDWHDSGSRNFQNINVTIQALASQNKLKVLSRPNITTLSGEEAEVLIGGQLPIPSSHDGDISIEWKDYGISLKIKPVVDKDNKITSKIEAEVSSIDNAVSVPTSAGTIPGLISRRASTTLSVPDGQTMAIGGLMNNEDTKVITKFPFLGDIPVIGEFFKHTSKSHVRRELMILITPTIVTVNDPVKGTDKMQDTLEEHKRELRDMKDIYPNDPPRDVESDAKMSEKGSDSQAEKLEPQGPGPLYKQRDTSNAPSWTAKAEAEMRQQEAQAAAAAGQYLR